VEVVGHKRWEAGPAIEPRSATSHQPQLVKVLYLWSPDLTILSGPQYPQQRLSGMGK
jgi:hypothetical protein